MSSEKKKAKKAAKAEEKAAKKANKTPMDSATKETIIKSITAFVCVVAICITSVSATSKYAEAMKKIGTAGGTAVSDGTATDGTATDGTATDGTATDGTATDGTATDGTATDGTATDGTATDGTPADGTAADTTAPNGSAGSATTAPAGGSSATATDPTKFTKAQIVTYYNNALKTGYAQVKKIKKSEQIKITVDDVTGGTVIKNIANAIVKKYATASESERTFTNGKASDGKLAEDFALPSKLQAAGAKTASIKKSGSGYEVNITIVPESATLTKFPVYNKQCSYPLDLASVDLSPATVVQADFTYAGTTLKATVDAKGRVTSATVYMPLEGTGGGKAVGITLTANVHGSWNHTSTYTY